MRLKFWFLDGWLRQIGRFCLRQYDTIQEFNVVSRQNRIIFHWDRPNGHVMIVMIAAVCRVLDLWWLSGVASYGAPGRVSPSTSN